MESSSNFIARHQQELCMKTFAPDLSAISEDDKAIDTSYIENQAHHSYSLSNAGLDEESDGESNISKNMLKFKISHEDKSNKTDQDSIDSNTRSYQGIISSFKSIHDKIEKWNQK